MFIIEEKTSCSYPPIGCAGFRVQDDIVDIYNIIRGEKSSSPEARISDAIGIMCSYIRSVSDKAIGCVVLADNPALDWYQSLGFDITAMKDGFVDVVLNESKFRYVPIVLGEDIR
jgi:hypothetical protein